MKKIITKIYRVDELVIEDAVKVIRRYREEFSEREHGWGHEARETLRMFISLFDDIFNVEWGYNPTSGHARANWDDDNIEALKGVRLWKYINSQYMHRKNTDGALYIEGYPNCPLTGICFDYTILEPIAEFMEHPDTSFTFDDLIQRCLDAWIAECVGDWAHQSSEDYIREEILADDLWFTAEGVKYELSEDDKVLEDTEAPDVESHEIDMGRRMIA